MNISSVTSATNSSQSSSQVQKKELTQQDFLNLFTTQMKFQNPLEPLDNYQMAAQLAQFNTVDALTKMNGTLEQLAANQASLSHLQASSLIGKKIEAKGNRLSLQQAEVSEGVYQLARPGNVVIQIFNSSGNLVRQIQAGWKDTSKQSIGWDGRNQGGAVLADGIYTFRVLAADEKGQAVPVTTYQIGKVTGVSFENGTAYFQLGSERIALSDILSILN